MSHLRRIGQIGRSHRMIPLGRLVMVAQAVLALVFVGALLIADGLRAPWATTDFVELSVEDAAGLDADNEPLVSIAGVEVGEVSKIRYENGEAIVTLAIEDRAARDLLRADATADISPRSALNDLTVDLEPGTASRPLPEGIPITARRTESHVPLDELVGVLDADTRAWTQVLLGELEPALRGRSDDLAAGLRELGEATDPTRGVVAALAARERLLTRLIANADQVFAALAKSGPALAETVRAGRATFDITTARNEELASTFSRLPGTLAALDAALTETQELAGPLNPALDRLGPFAEQLPGAVDALDRFVPAARRLVTDLRGLTRDGREPIAELEGVLDRLGPTARGLTGGTEDLRTALAALDEEKAGIKTLGENFSGVFSTNDVNGPMLRGLGYFEAFRCENFGFSGQLFPECGPPPASTSRRPRGLKGLSPAQMILGGLLEICRGSDDLLRNELACLVAFYSPETARELASLAGTESGRDLLGRARSTLGELLPAGEVDRLRERLGRTLGPSELEIVLPAGPAPAQSPRADGGANGERVTPWN